jgi:hypothetical protein
MHDAGPRSVVTTVGTRGVGAPARATAFDTDESAGRHLTWPHAAA